MSPYCETGKKKYATRKEAWRKSLYFFIKYGGYSTAYVCKKCKRFHLTTKIHNFVPPKEWVEGFNKWYGQKIL